ncbi:MAG TPA: hypothetical protein VJQ84_07250 [Solirubrobacterales bacterium]|nr:hypothetical protein [Solirubrobacterales bacterium]
MRASLAIALAACATMALSAAGAWAGPGYRPDAAKPTIDLSAEVPTGVAVDQSSQVIYVAEASRSLFNIQPGLVEQLSSSGIPTASSPFGTGGQDFFVSVAVNPLTHGIYAYQIQGNTPQGTKGESKVSTFSSSGALGTSFSPANAQAESLAADASGRVYFPNNATGSVQIFSSSGSSEGSFTCSGCPGGAFVTPQSVALDSAGKVYVVDSANGGRVVRLSSSGAYESTLQSGQGAVAVAVDTSSNEVFVGDLTSGTYHVVAFDSAGSPFDDFGARMATKSAIDVISGQLAVNSTTHKVYLSNPGGGNLRVFERIASIPAPTVSAGPSSPGQTKATLGAEIETKGHAVTSCAFQLVTQAEFQANGFANASTLACSPLPGEEEGTRINIVASGLTPSTSYDYRVKVSGYGGEAVSAAQQFETLPPLPPEATTGSASALTKTTATLGAAVNAKGGVVSDCHFEWVTEAAFEVGGFAGASTKACTPTPSGNTSTSVTGKVSGLSAGTGYRFRVIATNNSGTTPATDKNFATPAETCAENSSLCPIEEPPETPPTPPASPPGGELVAPLPPQPKPLKCRKGFKKKKVRGKPRCVRIKKRPAKR